MPAAIKFLDNQKLTIKQYYEAGLSTVMLGHIYDRDPKVMARVLRTMDVDIKPKPFKFNGEFAEELCEKYKNGLEVSELAKEYKLDKECIINTLKRNGIEIRQLLKLDYHVNKDFFEIIDSEDKAYWLGFMLADGCVTKDKDGVYNTINLQLASCDREHLEKFNVSIGSDHPILVNKNNRGSVSVRFTCTKMANDLIKHGVIPKKTFKCKKSEGIPIELERHFWRGCIDGDGFISSDMKQMGFCGDFDLVYSFWEYCNSLVDLGGKYKPCCPRKIYQMSIGSICRLIVLQDLYDNCNVYLDRKKRLFDLLRVTIV